MCRNDRVLGDIVDKCEAFDTKGQIYRSCIDGIGKHHGQSFSK